MVRLQGIELKIARAKAHLHEVEEAIDAFARTAFDSLRLQADPETGERVFQLGELRHPDACIGLMIGDVLSNLRAALDHLAFQLVRHPLTPGEGKPPRDREIAFPICDDPAKFKDAEWKIRGAAPGVDAHIERLQPYPDRSSPILFGPSRLGVLRDANDWDKHRLVHLVENELSSVGLLHPERVESFTPRDPGRLEANAEIARYKVRSDLDPDVDVGFYLATDVTFEEGPANGRSVKLLLAEMRVEVSGIAAVLAPYIAP